MPFQSEDPDCFWTNQTEQLAHECLIENPGAFFDGCKQTCVNDLFWLHLSQGLELEHFVYGKLFPVLVFLVVVANVLVALVLSQKHMVTPTNIVLKYMALADLCVGIIPLPWNLFYHTLKNYENDDNLDISWCYMYKYLMDVVPPIFHCIAMWLTVLLAFQRFLSINFPLRSREICSVRNVRISTCVITVVSLLCGLPKAVDFTYEVFDSWAYIEQGEWQKIRTCGSRFTFIVNVFGPTTFFNVYFWTRVCGFILLPSFLLIILNALLIRGIRKAQKRKEHLLREKRSREAQRQNESNSTSLMLVTVVTIFLIVNLPQAFLLALLCLNSTFGLNIPFLNGSFTTIFMLCSNMCVMATYPINFGIYCFMSSSFRETFKLLFCSTSCRKRLRHRLTSQAGSGSAAFSRISVRRSDPSVSVQLSGQHSNAEVSQGYPTTIVHHEANDPKLNSSNNDTVFL